MEQTFVIMATTENVLRVMQRMASLLTRNRLKIQQIQVTEMGMERCAHLCLILRTDEQTVEKLIKQLRKMSDLLEVSFINYETKYRRYDYVKQAIFKFA